VWRRFVPLSCASAAFAALIASAQPAHAAGLYVADRGVRPLSRGGAFVAGADDLGAIWYNPAGLSYSKPGVLADFSWVNYSSDYTRRTQVADASGVLHVYQYPEVSGSTPILPIPTLAISTAFGEKKEFTAAFGVIAPYTAVTSYPETVNGQPSPSRFSLVSLDGSALIVPGLYASYRPVEQFRIGMGVQAVVGTFRTTSYFSACPADRLVCAAEDPQYDTLSELKVGPIFAPSANFGMIGAPIESLRIGASFQLPVTIDAPATVNVRLPTAAVFDKAYQNGSDAHVRFKLPAVLRAGVEYRAKIDDKRLLRTEFAYVREFWSMHDSIDVRPDNLSLVNITGFPSPFGVSPISIPRKFQDSDSFRLGGEYSFGLSSQYTLDLRAGVAYETSAIPVAYVSPLTTDADKLILSLGGSVHVGEHWRFDLMYARVVSFSVTVPPDQAAVPRVNPVAGNPTATDAINGGDYHSRANIVGVGVAYAF
jgi:long-chain fatty acid transport protein